MKFYRYVGTHPEDLEGGRPVEPGEFLSGDDLDPDAPKTNQLLEDDLLIEVSKKDYQAGTAQSEAAPEQQEEQTNPDQGGDS